MVEEKDTVSVLSVGKPRQWGRLRCPGCIILPSLQPPWFLSYDWVNSTLGFSHQVMAPPWAFSFFTLSRHSDMKRRSPLIFTGAPPSLLPVTLLFPKTLCTCKDPLLDLLSLSLHPSLSSGSALPSHSHSPPKARIHFASTLSIPPAISALADFLRVCRSVGFISKLRNLLLTENKLTLRWVQVKK